MISHIMGFDAILQFGTAGIAYTNHLILLNSESTKIAFRKIHRDLELVNNYLLLILGIPTPYPLAQTLPIEKMADFVL